MTLPRTGAKQIQKNYREKTRARPETGRTYVPYAVYTFTTRVSPSRPGVVSMTLHNIQMLSGVWYFNTLTLSILSRRPLLFDHFDRLLTVGRYSCTKRYIWSINFCVFCFVFNLASFWSCSKLAVNVELCRLALKPK